MNREERDMFIEYQLWEQNIHVPGTIHVAKNEVKIKPIFKDLNKKNWCNKTDIKLNFFLTDLKEVRVSLDQTEHCYFYSIQSQLIYGFQWVPAYYDSYTTTPTF